MIALKSDGVRYALFLTQRLERTRQNERPNTSHSSPCKSPPPLTPSSFSPPSTPQFVPNPRLGVALFVDRSWNMWEVEVVAPEELFVGGTILEGELVWQQPASARLVFLAFDAASVAGRDLRHLAFGRCKEYVKKSIQVFFEQKDVLE